LRLAPRTGPRNYKCILVVTPLAFWECDWSILPMATRLREYSRTRAAAILSSVHRSAVTKGLGTTTLMHIFQTLIIDIKDCLGHPQRSQLCAACENGIYLLDRFKHFVN